MSKYTTEVRYICEEQAGLTASVGGANVDQTVAASWDKIFTTQCTFWDESYRPVLCKKILKHYYLREIGTETYGIWQLWMNTRLEEIMPYYNQLYASAEMDFNPFDDVDLKTDQARVTGRELAISSNESFADVSQAAQNASGSNATVVNDSSSTGSTGESATVESQSQSGTESGTDNLTRDMSKTDRYSDTPQGALTGIQNNTYLTNARIVDDEGTDKNTHSGDSASNMGHVSGSKDSASSSTGSGTVTGGRNTQAQNSGNLSGGKRAKADTHDDASIDGMKNHIKGKSAGKSYSELLNEYRDTMLNIDMMVIDEFSDLFMLLW